MNNYQVTMKSKRKCGPRHHITSPWQHTLCSFTSLCYTSVLFSSFFPLFWYLKLRQMSLEFLSHYPPRCLEVTIFYKGYWYKYTSAYSFSILGCNHSGAFWAYLSDISCAVVSLDHCKIWISRLVHSINSYGARNYRWDIRCRL